MNYRGNNTNSCRFGKFLLNHLTGELIEKNGHPIKLQQQPAKVLSLLAKNSGELVTREKIRDLLWQDETFVDYEQGINYCVKQIRIALDDNARDPRFIETLPRRGYRFIAEVENIDKTLDISEIPIVDKTHSDMPIQSEPSHYYSKSTFWLVTVVFALVSSFVVWNFAFGNEYKNVSATTSKNPEAQDAYLKGKHWFAKGDSDSIKKSIAFFDQALRQDENFASAYLSRGDAFYQLGLFGAAKTHDVFPKAKKDALRAFELENGLADALTLLGSITFRYDWDWEKAEDYFKHAIMQNPESANAHHDYAWLLVAQKRFNKAISSIKEAQRLDPTAPRTNIDVGWIYIRARRYNEAVDQINRTLELEPDFAGIEQCLECAFVNMAMYTESVKNGIKMMKNSGATEEDIARILSVEPQKGTELIEEWRLREILKEAKTSYVPAYYLALQYAAMSDKENAFLWLEKAFKEKNAGLITLQVDQVWDKYSKEPFYQKKLKEIGLTQ